MSARVLLGAAAAAAALAACGSARPSAGPSSTTTARSRASAATASARSQPRPRRPSRRHSRPRPDPGSLPQTPTRPRADTPAFRAEMAALWHAVTTGAAPADRTAFFPERAYLQVKAIADPQGDYAGRLLGGYARDIAAAHALLVSHTGRAQLIRLAVPGSFAHWVPPNTCANRVGYWEVPNTRVVYRQGRIVRSFGIASMISWRGVWYVVHLGAVVPTTSGGTVDAPALGPGVSAPSTTC